MDSNSPGRDSTTPATGAPFDPTGGQGRQFGVPGGGCSGGSSVMGGFAVGGGGSGGQWAVSPPQGPQPPWPWPEFFRGVAPGARNGVAAIAANAAVGMLVDILRDPPSFVTYPDGTEKIEQR